MTISFPALERNGCTVAYYLSDGTFWLCGASEGGPALTPSECAEILAHLDQDGVIWRVAGSWRPGMIPNQCDIEVQKSDGHLILMESCTGIPSVRSEAQFSINDFVEAVRACENVGSTYRGPRIDWTGFRRFLGEPDHA